MESVNRDLAEAKRILRREILRRRGELNDAERRRAATLITERILGHQFYYRSDALLGFASYGSEIDTDEILSEAVRQGKKLYLPKTEGETLVFYRVYDLSGLCIGYKGIREPAGDTERYEYDRDDADRTLMLMPGVAFDAFRSRIGYGKGFYDRYLEDKPKLWTRTIGIGFECQLVSEVPCDESDIKPFQVICI